MTKLLKTRGSSGKVASCLESGNWMAGVVGFSAKYLIYHYFIVNLSIWDQVKSDGNVICAPRCASQVEATTRMIRIGLSRRNSQLTPVALAPRGP